MQKKFMVRATLSGNSGENQQIGMLKVSGKGILRSQTPEILKSGVSGDNFSI